MCVLFDHSFYLKYKILFEIILMHVNCGERITALLLIEVSGEENSFVSKLLRSASSVLVADAHEEQIYCHVLL